MDTAVIAASITSGTALIVSLINVSVIRSNKNIMLEIKAAVLEFENRFIEKLNGMYVRSLRFDDHVALDDSMHEYVRDKLAPEVSAISVRVARMEGCK